MTLKNFMTYENFHVELGEDPIHGFFGPNGCGKSTLLHAVRLFFSKFAGFDALRLDQSLGRYKHNGSGGDWELAGDFTSDCGDYTVKIGSNHELWKWGEIPGLEDEVVVGVVDGHPDGVRKTLTEQVWMATYDQQLHQFQIEKSRWKKFKPLFEAVTGYEVRPMESDKTGFTDPSLTTRDRQAMANIDRYILGMEILKPDGPIRENQCSDGEKKVIKHFTHLFNKPDDEVPSIVLIDNIEMHISRDRQLPLLNALEGCFPEVQIIFTTHGDSIICHYDARRLTNLYYKDLDQNVEPWRKEAMRIAAVAETLLPRSPALSGLMDSFRKMSRSEVHGTILALFDDIGSEFAERIQK